MSDEFCYYLPYITANDANHEIKTLILSDTVTYNMYHTWITLAPGIVWSMFLGTWIDKYISGRKAIFIVGSITQTMEAAINTLNSYYFDSTLPLGVFLSGKLINLSPVGGNGQLHNTGLIFFISSCVAFLAFIWSVFAINQQNDKQLFEKYFSEHLGLIDTEDTTSGAESNDNNNKSSDNNNNDRKELENKKQNIGNETKHPLRLLFDINNAKDIVTTCTKKRPNYVRAQIWLIIGAMFCGYFIAAAPGAFFFQFIEKVYYWDASTFTQISSMGMIVNSIIIIFLTPLLIKVLKLNEMFLAIIGFFGAFLHMIALGVILSPIGYLLAILFGCTGTLGPVGFKTHLSNIVEPSELGKVFTLMGVIDGFAPLIASSIFTIIFEKTIDSSIPGTCFLILAAITLLTVKFSINNLHGDIQYAPVVKTRSGQVRGIVKDLDDGTQLYLYDGIPYAEPPLNELRFSKPVPKSSWTGVYDAIKYRNSCIQPDKLEPDNNIPEESYHSEDCLFLSVWTPNHTRPDGQKRAVLYWFYGGGFETGTIFSLATDMRYLSVLGDVVVVAVNYRLGPWGFLYAGTEDAAGNMGLYDQLLGLKWVN
ncbi:unnamed protein product, partial [Oppiella nova]